MLDFMYFCYSSMIKKRYKNIYNSKNMKFDDMFIQFFFICSFVLNSKFQLIIVKFICYNLVLMIFLLLLDEWEYLINETLKRLHCWHRNVIKQNFPNRHSQIIDVCLCLEHTFWIPNIYIILYFYLWIVNKFCAPEVSIIQIFYYFLL